MPNGADFIRTPSAFIKQSHNQAMATQLIDLAEVERLSPLVIRVLAGNPGKFTLQGTNTYLIGTSDDRLLVDTGEGKESWSQALSAVLSSENATISHAIITHYHYDHAGGIRSLLELCPAARIYKHQPIYPQLDIKDGQLFHTEGATLRAFYCPGHTEDHMAFILEQEDAMFTGDNVLGHGTSVFEDLALYMESLRRMKDQVAGRAYPGHGAIINDSRVKIAEYIKHRQQREDEVLQVLESAAKGEMGADKKKALTAREVVDIVYQDIPKRLHDAAERGVILILQKLCGDGKIVNTDNGNKWQVFGR